METAKNNITLTLVNGILGVEPKLERRLRGFEPGDIVRLNFRMRRQIVKDHISLHTSKCSIPWLIS